LQNSYEPQSLPHVPQFVVSDDRSVQTPASGPALGGQ